MAVEYKKGDKLWFKYDSCDCEFGMRTSGWHRAAGVGRTDKPIGVLLKPACGGPLGVWMDNPNLRLDTYFGEEPAHTMICRFCKSSNQYKG